jgi:hypothetical protein
MREHNTSSPESSATDLHVDTTIVLFVDVGSVIDAHILRRHRAGKSIDLLGRSWLCASEREYPNDGKRVVELVALPKPGPLMCLACSSLDLRHAKGADIHCGECRGTELTP